VISDRQLRQTIMELKSLERKCFGSRQRFAFYECLGEVLKFYRRLRRKEEAKGAARRIAELLGVRRQKRTHSIRVIIDATSAADDKTKSRWARALRYAWYGRRWWKDLNELFRSNGGPAGCAEKVAALHPRTPRGRVRSGGKNLVPNILSLADSDLIRAEQLYVRNGGCSGSPTCRMLAIPAPL
jgi:hypothetical protein